MKWLKQALLVVVIIGTASWTWFEDAPSSDDLSKALVESLPQVLSIDGVKIEAQENTGTETRPHYETRFTADARVREDLFQRTSNLGLRDVVAKTRDGGTQIKLYGIATSEKKREVWVTEIALEEKPVDPSEKPLSYFKSPVLEGSSEYTAAVAEFEKKVEEQRRLDEAKRQEEERLLQVRRDEEARRAEEQRAAQEKREREAQANAERAKREAMANAGSSLSGTWRGKFRCGGTLLRDELSIQTDSSGNVRIQHSWFGVGPNSSHNDGIGVLVGGYYENGTFKTEASHWVKRPRGATLLPLSGAISADGRTLYLKFSYGCSAFEATR